MRRMILPSCPFRYRALTAFLSVLLLSAFRPPEALSRSITIRPDRSGDAPTFQAGVDSLLRASICCFDSLVVMPGVYDEAVEMGGPSFFYSALIVCPGGPSRTAVRAIHFPTSLEPATGSISIQGLQIRDSVQHGDYGPTVALWDRCRFDQGFRGRYLGGYELHRCEVLGPASFQGSFLIEECRFVGATASVDSEGSEVGGSEVFFKQCTFDGPADPAVQVIGRPSTASPSAFLDGCTFRGSRRGVLLDLRGSGGFLAMGKCSFEDVAGAAIDKTIADSVGPLQNVALVSISHSRFLRCGLGVHLLGTAIRSWLSMEADTILDCASTAIQAHAVEPVTVDDVVIERCGGSGIVLTASPPLYPHGYFAPFLAEVDGCSIHGVAGDGIVLDGRGLGDMQRSAQVLNTRISGAGGAGVTIYADSIRVAGSLVTDCRGGGISAVLMPQSQFSRTPPTASFDHNTLAGNGGAGWRLVHGVPLSAPVCSVIENLAVANAGAGFVADLGLTASANDSWRNAGGAYAGTTAGPSDLIADPQLCDPVSNDFHVAESSPCAPSGVHGQIGAFGLGCERMHVAVELLDRVKKHEPKDPRLVGLLVLGSRYFDPRRIDVASTTFLGARPASAESVAVLGVSDSIADGYANLILYFRRNAAHEPRGERFTTLEGRTVDGTPFVGVLPELRRIELAELAVERQTPNEPRLAIDAVTPNPATTPAVRVRFTMPRSEPATLELVDVAGRRLFTRDLSLGAGRFEVTVEADEHLNAGIYWLRLSQAGVTATTRVVVVR